MSGTCNVGSGAITTVWDWLNQVNTANFAGHTDWRLPSQSGCTSCYTGSCSSCDAHELETILNCGFTPCIDPIFRRTEPYGAYWSSTTNAPFPDNAWYVSFFNGYVNFNGKVSRDYAVRAVR